MKNSSLHNSDVFRTTFFCFQKKFLRVQILGMIVMLSLHMQEIATFEGVCILLQNKKVDKLSEVIFCQSYFTPNMHKKWQKMPLFLDINIIHILY